MVGMFWKRHGNLPDSTWPKEVRSAGKTNLGCRVLLRVDLLNLLFSNMSWTYFHLNSISSSSSIVLNLDWTLSQNLTHHRLFANTLTARVFFAWRSGFSCANGCTFNMTNFWEILVSQHAMRVAACYAALVLRSAALRDENRFQSLELEVRRDRAAWVFWEK